MCVLDGFFWGGGGLRDNIIPHLEKRVLLPIFIFDVSSLGLVLLNNLLYIYFLFTQVDFNIHNQKYVDNMSQCFPSSVESFN